MYARFLLYCKCSTCNAGTSQDILGHNPLKKVAGKSETLSLRLDPMTKFALEFAAGTKGQTLTTFVERSIFEACDRVKTRGPGFKKVTWRYFWDPHEGIRTVNLLDCHGYPLNKNQEELTEFTLAHWEFFYEALG